MEQSRVQQTCQDTDVMDAQSNYLLNEFEDQRETKDYFPAREERSSGTDSGRPFRGEQKRRSDSIHEYHSDPGAISPAPVDPATTSFKAATVGLSNRTAGIVLEEQGMIPHDAMKVMNSRNTTICAAVHAEKRRVSRTKTAEGGTFISAEIGGLVRLFFNHTILTR